MAPFVSRSQARFMFARHPRIAREFAAHTPSIKALPDKVKSMEHGYHLVAARKKKGKEKASKEMIAARLMVAKKYRK